MVCFSCPIFSGVLKAKEYGLVLDEVIMTRKCALTPLMSSSLQALDSKSEAAFQVLRGLSSIYTTHLRTSQVCKINIQSTHDAFIQDSGVLCKLSRIKLL